MSIRKSCHIIAFLAIAMPAFLAGCNSKTEDVEEKYTPASNVAVTAFSLKANSEVAPKLDSVFFAIDLKAGIIFNADSLPVGTDISSLVPVITYPSSVTGASIRTIDGTHDYKESPSTPLNFTEPAQLTLTAEDGTTRRTYSIKINVHKQNPAQLLWSNEQIAALPGGTTTEPKCQKTISFKGTTYCYIQLQDGMVSLFIESASDGNFNGGPINIPFTPALRTLTAVEDRMYMLSDTGELYETADGRNWDDCSEQWECITGPYLGSVTGIKRESGKLIHTAWPAETLPESSVDSDFPLSGFTNPGTVTTEWSPWPVLFIYGGEKADGTLSGQTWGFDGERWSVISSGKSLKVKNATLIPYWLARPTTTMWLTDNRDAWLIIGGTTEDGTCNRKVWYSFDNGVNWFEGAETMDLPVHIHDMIQADAIVQLVPREASAEKWRQSRGRLDVTVEGSTILWTCPEIYMYGGITPTGATYNSVWRAALARFTFTPII